VNGLSCSVARSLLLVGGLVVTGSVVVCATGLSSAEAIARADQAYAQRFRIEAEAPSTYFETYRPFIERAIEDYALAVREPGGLSIQSQSHVYNRLSQLHYELAKVMISHKKDQEEIEAVLVAGKEYGFASLALQPGFDRGRFSETLGLVWDAAALVWTADCWGTWLGYHPFEGLVNLPKIKAMYERAIRVDEAFWEGSAHIGLGALLATSPGFMGGDLPRAKGCFEQSLVINPLYLTASVVYAESYGFTHSLGKRSGIRDRDLLEERLAFVGEAAVGSEWPFWDWVAKAEAQLLLLELERLLR